MRTIYIVNYPEEQLLYLATSLASAILCVVFGLLLILMRRFRHSVLQNPVYPGRYIMARRILGIAYLVIGMLTLFQLVTAGTGIAPKQSEFLPISGLVISTSQALLFTAALLSLYNSCLLRRDMILWNILPIGWFVLMYLLFLRVPGVGLVVKKTFFSFYIVQLIGYSVAFFVERDTYLRHLEDYFDDWGLRKHRRNGVTVLFLCSLAVGVAALTSYYFTELWHLTVFIACYTAYYVAVAVYFFNYRRYSGEIADVTTPEEWDNPERENYMNEILKETTDK